MNQKSFLRRLADTLIQRWVGHAYIEEFLGDLDEMYEDRLAVKGKFIAEGMYWVDTIHLIFGFPSTVKKQNHTMFIGNMIKISWRSALRHKQFTVLNLLGLTLGIATCLAIGLYVYEETSYDTFHANGDRIYRINQPMIWGDWNEQMPMIGPGITEAIRTDIPDFEEVTRIMHVGEHLMQVTIDDRATHFNESKYYVAEDNFFKVFSFPFLKGDPNSALKEANSMVITASTAKRYFGDTDPMGKLIEARSPTGTRTLFNVTGVLADIPTQSHLQFDMLGSLSSVTEFKDARSTWIMDNFWHLWYGQGRNGRGSVDKQTSGPSSQVGGTNYAGSLQSNIRTIHKGKTLDTLSPASTRHLPCEVAWFPPVWSIGEPGICDDLWGNWNTRSRAVVH